MLHSREIPLLTGVISHVGLMIGADVDLGRLTGKGPEYSGCNWCCGVEVLRGATGFLGSSTMPTIVSKAAFSVSTSLVSLDAFCLYCFNSVCISD